MFFQRWLEDWSRRRWDRKWGPSVVCVKLFVSSFSDYHAKTIVVSGEGGNGGSGEWQESTSPKRLFALIDGDLKLGGALERYVKKTGYPDAQKVRMMSEDDWQRFGRETYQQLPPGPQKDGKLWHGDMGRLDFYAVVAITWRT